MKHVFSVLLLALLITGFACPKKDSPEPTTGAQLILNTMPNVVAAANVAGSNTTETTPQMKLTMEVSNPTPPGGWGLPMDVMIPPGVPQPPVRVDLIRDLSQSQQVMFKGWFMQGGSFVQMANVSPVGDRPNTYLFTIASDPTSPGIIIMTDGMMP